jgi:tRNA A37 methylthiotransferase MiaB
MMSKIKVAWIQPNFQQGPKKFNSYYLPYSAGIVWSFAIADPEINEKFELTEIVWQREPQQDLVDRLKNHHVIAFSTYVWSHHYNYSLAKKIKQENPQCLIIFGGPEPAITDPDLFKKEPYMDIVVKYEGEIVFKEILRHYHDRVWEHIPGLLLNQDQKIIDTGPSNRVTDLQQLHSPYLLGIFDRLVSDNPEIKWGATLETNRGCPYQCTFCDWGSLTYSKVNKFNLDRVFEELEWIGKHCNFITIADANFGMFPERDNLIVDKLIEVQKKYNKIKNFSITWAKNQKKEVIEIVSKLINDGGMPGMGLTVSVQSMNSDVLKNVKRFNLQEHKLEKIFLQCEKKNIPLHTELILGLPGETVDSWKQNFWNLFEIGNHNGISIYGAQLLANAEMNLLQRKMYKIESAPVSDYLGGSSVEYDPELYESVDLVISTSTISREQMLDLWVWTSFIQTFHINGISTYTSRLLRKYLNVTYQEFYDKLFDYIMRDDWFKNKLLELRDYYHNWIKKGKINHPPINSVEIFGWNLLHLIMLNIYKDRKLQTVFEMLEKFININWNLPDALLEQMMDFQKKFVIEHEQMQNLPIIQNYDYDFLGYLREELDIRSSVRYKFDTREDKCMDFDTFLENLYFGRKRNFGKTIISSLDNDVGLY